MANIPAMRVSDPSFIYNYSDVEFIFATAEASQKTSLEPLPTSYILFPFISIRADTQEEENKRRAERDEQKNRMQIYCENHYSHYKTRGAAFEADPFANVITFYWPLMLKEDEESTFLNQLPLEPELRCEQLVDRYNFDQASSLMMSLLPDANNSESIVGPVMVLDLGFDALVAPMDKVDTDNLARIPFIWDQMMEEALRDAVRKRTEQLEKVKALRTEISVLERAYDAASGPFSGKRGLRRQIKQKEEELLGITSSLFAKDSWGRAIACAVSGPVIAFLGAYLPNTELISDKMSSYCSAEAT